MPFDHTEQLASRCKHSIHPSLPAHTPWCPQCVLSTAQADVETTGKRLEAEGGTDAPRYMRDRAWNVARLQHTITAARVEKTKKRDQLRQEAEEDWVAAHQRFMAQCGLIPPGPLLHPTCKACAVMKEPCEVDKRQATNSGMAWWERPGALVAVQILVPNTPPQSTSSIKHPRLAKAKRPSYLREFIQSHREARSVSDVHRRAWEDRCQTERAVRRKYDLPDDFDIDAEFFANPISASHACHHYRQIQDGQRSAQRRANRYTRRAEGYKPSRSSLALSELAGNVMMDGTDVQKVRLAEDSAELQRMASVVASEVGYLYFVGDVDGFEDWMDDVERSHLSLIYRKVETDDEVGEEL